MVADRGKPLLQLEKIQIVQITKPDMAISVLVKSE
jgi:hypothetical protein